MTNRAKHTLNTTRRRLIAGVAVITTAGPIAAGAVTAQAFRATAGTAAPLRQDRSIAALPESPEDIAFRGNALRPDTPGLVNPVVLRAPSPRYTEAAMHAKIQGTVSIKVVVAPDGTVSRARITKSLDATLGLDANALETARKWTFKPGSMNGHPVAVLTTVSMDFAVR